MSRNFRSIFMRIQISKRTQKHFALWFNRNASSPEDQDFSRSQPPLEISGFQNPIHNIKSSRSNSSASWRQLNSQRGFAYIFLLAILPIILSAGFFLLFSQYLQKNWMQSLHTCRIDLLLTQKKTSRHLENLLNLNSSAKSLRVALRSAQAELGVAISSSNPAWVAKASARVAQVKKQQKALEQMQKTIIFIANQEMSRGLARVIKSLKQQNKENQSRLPDFFEYQIHSIRSTPAQLAVQPDIPETAPVYELKPEFKDQQALNVSWISEFQSSSKKRSRWILNHHKKKDSCSATLSNGKDKFQPVLKEAKSFLKL